MATLQFTGLDVIPSDLGGNIASSLAYAADYLLGQPGIDQLRTAFSSFDLSDDPIPVPHVLHASVDRIVSRDVTLTGFQGRRAATERWCRQNCRAAYLPCRSKTNALAVSK